MTPATFDTLHLTNFDFLPSNLALLSTPRHLRHQENWKFSQEENLCQERLVVKFLILLKSNLGLSVILYNFQSLMSLIPFLSHTSGHGHCRTGAASNSDNTVRQGAGCEDEEIYPTYQESSPFCNLQRTGR